MQNIICNQNTTTAAMTASSSAGSSGSKNTSNTKDSGTKKPRAAGDSQGGGSTGMLPTVAEHDPLAGTVSLTSGRGVQLQPPSPSALLAALKLLEDGAGASSSGASATSAPTPPLPTGASWPMLSVVTPEGLQQHAVQPNMTAGVDSRDPRRLTMSKRRVCEE